MITSPLALMRNRALIMIQSRSPPACTVSRACKIRKELQKHHWLHQRRSAREGRENLAHKFIMFAAEIGFLIGGLGDFEKQFGSLAPAAPLQQQSACNARVCSDRCVPRRAAGTNR